MAVIAVNSARPNPQPWRSSGLIPASQLRALTALCGDPRVAQRFVFVITHYAPCRADGSPDRHSHGLVNAEAFLAACGGLRRGAILHGHIHGRFQLSLPQLPVRIFGAGSTTSAHHGGLWLFEIDAQGSTAVPGRWLSDRYVLDRAGRVEL